MDMIYVNSSNLVAVGYDSDTYTLRVQFNSGVYDYYNVPYTIYTGLINAASKGQYHHQHIKNSFQFKKVG